MPNSGEFRVSVVSAPPSPFFEECFPIFKASFEECFPIFKASPSIK